MIHALEALDRDIPDDSPHAAFDIETLKEDHSTVRMAGFYDGHRYMQERTVVDLLQAVCTREYRSWKIYAHFGGRFDFIHAAEAADRLGWRWRALMAGKSPRAIALLIYRGSHVFHFLDSWAVLPAKLRTLSEALTPELVKGVVDFETVSDADLSEYLERDCRVLYRVIERARSLFRELGTDMKRTIAGTSLALFRRTELRRPWPVHAWTRELTTRALIGGRVEIFQRRAPRLWVADVNSMYPYQMATFDPPVHSPRRVGPRAAVSRYGIYEVEAEIPEMPIPPLPLHADRLYFPVGTFRTVVWGPELLAAQEMDARIRIIRGIEWEPEPGAFKGFVGKLYLLKLKGEPYRTIAKIAMNALYGKFSERGGVHELVKLGDELPRVGRMEGERYIPGDTILSLERGIVARSVKRESPHMLHHVGGWILSCARVHLWDLLTRSTGPAYCDTDSVFSRTFYRPSDEIGKLSIKAADNAFFMAPKLYCYDRDGKHVIASKGIPGADPCRNPKGVISGLCSLSQYVKAGKLYHGRVFKEAFGVDTKRLGGYSAPWETDPPVAGRDCPDGYKEAGFW